MPNQDQNSNDSGAGKKAGGVAAIILAAGESRRPGGANGGAGAACRYAPDFRRHFIKQQGADINLKDEIIIHAPREKVFAALNDPDVLTEAIPGCRSLEKESDNEFIATVVAKIGPVNATFKGEVTLSDIVAPESYAISGGGKAGPAGFAKGSARVRLGGRLMEATTKKLAGEFFQSFQRIVVGEGGGEPPEPEAPQEPQANRRLVMAALCLAVMGLAAYLLLK